MQLKPNNQSWKNLPAVELKPLDKYKGAANLGLLNLSPEEQVRRVNLQNQLGPSPLVVDAAFHVVKWHWNQK